MERYNRNEQNRFCIGQRNESIFGLESSQPSTFSFAVDSQCLFQYWHKCTRCRFHLVDDLPGDLERGKISASAFNFYRIAQALRIKLADLFGSLDKEYNSEFENDLVDIMGKIRRMDQDQRALYLAAFKWHALKVKNFEGLLDYKPYVPPKMKTVALLCKQSRSWADGRKASLNELRSIRNSCGVMFRQ